MQNREIFLHGILHQISLKIFKFDWRQKVNTKVHSLPFRFQVSTSMIFDFWLGLFFFVPGEWQAFIKYQIKVADFGKGITFVFLETPIELPNGLFSRFVFSQGVSPNSKTIVRPESALFTENETTSLPFNRKLGKHRVSPLKIIRQW